MKGLSVFGDCVCLKLLVVGHWRCLIVILFEVMIVSYVPYDQLWIEVKKHKLHLFHELSVYSLSVVTSRMSV